LWGGGTQFHQSSPSTIIYYSAHRTFKIHQSSIRRANAALHSFILTAAANDCIVVVIIDGSK
jgi:hypothetical protein